MRRLSVIALLAFTAIFFAACPDAGTSANTENTGAGNENAGAKPVEDVQATLVGLENKAHEAWKNKDGKFFEGMLADTFYGVVGTGSTDKAGIIKSISESPCEIKDFKLEDPKMTMVADDVAFITHKLTADYSCEGKTGQSPQYSVSLYLKQGDDWKGAFHQSLPASGAKGDLPAPKAPADLKSSEDELTKSLSESENDGWKAWAARDSKHFEDKLASGFVSFTALGVEDRDTFLKNVSEMKCEIKSFSLNGFKTTKLTENVALITYIAVADSRCGDVTFPGKVFSAGVYSKEGDTWKLAGYVESPAS